MSSEHTPTSSGPAVLLNGGSCNHGDELRLLLDNPSEVVFCVAFATSSGLNVIADKLKLAIAQGARASLFVGLDMYVTEPSALWDLFNMLRGKKGCELFLVKQGSSTFHPKAYWAVQGDIVKAFVGSANLTRGGLQSNAELSLTIATAKNSSLHRSLDAFREELRSQSGTRVADEIEISQYQREFQVAQRHSNRDYAKLRTYLEEYRADESEAESLGKRYANYDDARRLLDRMATGPASSRQEFLRSYEKLVGAKGVLSLWHSGSLFRHRNKVAGDFRIFHDMLVALKKGIGAAPEEVFAIVRTYIPKIRGFGPNVATEILNTYAPEEYPVLNNNPVKSLAHLGCSFRSPANFTPANYAEFTNLMKDLAKDYGFKTLGEVDHFLNFVYMKYVR